MLWEFDTKQRLFGSPVLQDGTLYQVGHGSLFALNAETGDLLWSSTVPIIGSTPFVTGESLYVETCNGIAALNSETGELIWQVQLADFKCDLEKDYPPTFLASSPIVTDTGVIMCTHENWELFLPNPPEPEGLNRVVCLDSETRTLLWEYSLNERAGYSPAFIDGKIIVNSIGMRVLDDRTGQELWSYADLWLSDTSPAVSHNAVVTVTKYDGIVFSIDITTHKLLWECSLDSDYCSAPAVYNGRIVVVTRDGTIVALDETTGDILWRKEVQEKPDFPAYNILRNMADSFVSSPAIANSKVYVGLWSGTFLCLELDTGEILWQYKTEGSIIASPAVADEKVFIASTDGKVYCFGIDPETYFQKAEQYDKQGNTKRARVFYKRAKDYYESQGNLEMVKKCEKKLNGRRYPWIAVVVVGCMIICAMVVYWKMHKSNKSR